MITLHPTSRGLALDLLGLRRQFRGDWSQRMPGFSSESDSNTIIAGEEQRDLSYYFFSLTTDIDRASKNPEVPTTQSEYSYYYGVRVHFIFASGCLLIPFGLQYLKMATLKEGDQLQMWEFIPSPDSD